MTNILLRFSDENTFISFQSTIHMLKSALKSIQDEKEALQTRVDDLMRELNDVKGDLSVRC